VGVIVGTTVRNTFALEVADLDGDGDPDLISGDESGRIVAWQNHGDPFGAQWTAHVLGNVDLPMQIASADLDRDNDLDLVVAHVGGPSLWQNEGSPFAGKRALKTIGNRMLGTVRVADMNGDGRLDVVAGTGLPWWRKPDANNWITVWYAPERPFDTVWQASDVGLAYYTPTGLAVGDLDDDGDQDIVIGTDHAPPVGDVDQPVPRGEWPDVYQVRAFRNDGIDRWAEVNVGRDPKLETLAYVAYHGYWGASVTHVSLADLDGDEDLDIVATERVEGDFLVMGWQNDGTPFDGELWAPSAIAKGPVHYWLEDSVLWAEVADIDLDGDLDVVSGSRAWLEAWPLSIWEHTGTAFGTVISETHWLRREITTRREDLWSGRIADLDRDGDPDLVTAGHALRAGEPSTIRAWENGGFSLEITPAQRTGLALEAMTYSVSAPRCGNYRQPVDLWISGLPVGMRATWLGKPVSPGGTAELTLVAHGTSPARDYSMMVVGIGGHLVRSEPFTLTVSGEQPHGAYLPLVFCDP
jgi:hypothetical protein